MLRDEHLARVRPRRDARADVHGDAADLAVRRPRPRPCARRPGPRARARATASTIACAQRIARAGPSNVAKNPSPAVSTSRPSKRASSRRTDRVVLLEQLAPAAVAELGGALGRADDVGEEHRREHAVGRRVSRMPGQELADLRRPSRPGRTTGRGRLREARRTSRPGSSGRGSARSRRGTRGRPAGGRRASARRSSGRRRARRCRTPSSRTPPTTRASTNSAGRVRARRDPTRRRPTLGTRYWKPSPWPQRPGSAAMYSSCSSCVASPHGHSSSRRSRTSAPWRISAAVRSGCAAAKSIASGPPSDSPMIAARSLPTASRTARMSSIRSSSVVAPGTRSDMPMPRLSKRMSRVNSASRSQYWRYCGSSQRISRCV